METNWTGTDEYGAYYHMNSSNYENVNRIGIIVKKGNFEWQTSSTYFNKDEFEVGSDGKIHIYSVSDSNNNLLLYSSAQQALA